MLTSNRAVLRMLGQCLLFAVVLATWSPKVFSQAWDAVKYFEYHIDKVTVAPVEAGTWNVKVIFSVTNPSMGGFWDIRYAVPFTSAGAGLTLDIGWDPASDFTNTGSANRLLSPVFPGLTPLGAPALGTGAAIPVQVRGLQGIPPPTPAPGSPPAPPAGVATACDRSQCPGVEPTGRFWVAKNVTPRPVDAVKYGRVAIEGKPVCNGIAGFTCPTTVAPFANVPVPSVVASFAFTATESLPPFPDPRRKIVDIAKCQQCHDNKPHGATVVPKLSLHGNNRTENLGLCVVCHNPNQTDVPYRLSGVEVPIDFKTMVHSIHAGGFRETPFVVIGFQSSVNDFSYVRFPRELRDCTNCHIKEAGKWTFELPLRDSVLGTTKNTGSGKTPTGAVCNYLTTPRCVDVDPANDVKISPTAAVCSSCHDKAEVQSHMIRTGGASFSTTQSKIADGTVNERCASCHGPGKEEDVLRAHEIRSAGGTSRGDD
jgi:hypothetical protein